MEFLVPRIQVLLHFKLCPSQDIWIRPRHCFALTLSRKLVSGLSRNLIRHVLHFSAGQDLVLTLHNNVGNNSKEGKCHQALSIREGAEWTMTDTVEREQLCFSFNLFGLWHPGVLSSPLSFHTPKDSQPTSTQATSPLEVRGAPNRFFWCPPFLTTS